MLPLWREREGVRHIRLSLLFYTKYYFIILYLGFQTKRYKMYLPSEPKNKE